RLADPRPSQRAARPGRLQPPIHGQALPLRRPPEEMRHGREGRVRLLRLYQYEVSRVQAAVPAGGLASTRWPDAAVPASFERPPDPALHGRRLMTRRMITVEMNRVEGDLEVKLELDDHTVTDAWCVGKTYRGFEQLLRGRDPNDALVIAPRICGICS